MSTTQSIYQRPPLVKQTPVTNNSSNNVSAGFSRPRQILANQPPISPPKPVPKPIPLQTSNQTDLQSKEQTLLKIEEMKAQAEEKSAQEASNAGIKKYAIIGAIVILFVAGLALMWVFYISKTRSAKAAFTSSDGCANSANSSGDCAKDCGSCGKSL